MGNIPIIKAEKIYMKIQIALMVLCLSLTSCFDSGGGGGSSPISADSVQEYLDQFDESASTEDSEIASEDGEAETNDAEDSIAENESEQDSNDDVASSEELFSFNRLTGECISASGLTGYNSDSFTECGDLSNQQLEGLNFKSKNYWKLNLSDSNISNSDLNFNKIAKYEVVYNQETFFDGVKYFFTKLYNQHIKHMESQKNRMTKNSDKVTVLKGELEALMESYEEETDPSVQKKLARKIKKKNKQIQKHKVASQYAMKKMYRHQNLSKNTFFMADGEPQMENPKVKNKKWLTVENTSDSKQIRAGSDLMNDEEFSISLWFRTDSESSSEGRIYNALYSGNDSSLIVGVQKNKVFFGHRDQNKKYHRSDYEFSYSDGEWHHILVSFQDNQFLIFADGSQLGSIQDSFLGFGPEYTTLGSYKLKNHVFSGDIDEVSAWSQALSLVDAQKLYNEGVPTQLKYHEKYTSLLRWWRMGDKTSRSVAGEVVE